MKFDYHTHTPLCQHASGHPREYVEIAKERGLEEIGFSDHNPMPTQFDEWRMAPTELPAYLDLVEEARLSHPDFPIRIGLECDFIPGYENHIRSLAQETDWDYLIGSVHYIEEDWDVDNPYKRELWKKRSVEEIWTLYFQRFTQAASSGLFDFLGHPDLVKKFGDKPSGDLLPYYKESLEAIADHGIAIELNTAGLRKDIQEIYPSHDFLQAAYQKKIPILINSDAHHPNEVGQGFDQAYALAQSVGYTHLTRFEKRKAISTPFA